MHPSALWTRAAPVALLAVSLTPARLADAHPRAMATVGLGAGVIALLVALSVDVALVIYGPFWSAVLGAEGVGVSVYFDPLSAVMFTLVAFIGVIVLLYSRNYLDGDRRQGTFYKWLCFTLASGAGRDLRRQSRLLDSRLDRHQRRAQHAAALLPGTPGGAACRQDEVHRQPVGRSLPDLRRGKPLDELWHARLS
jgi:NADH-Ubiquinone oxidoreductase (complex I), chain 5 N-terminus